MITSETLREVLALVAPARFGREAQKRAKRTISHIGCGRRSRAFDSNGR